MLYIIDGTGDADLPTYSADMGRGFCAALARRNRGHAVYLRGPTLFGSETYDIAEAMLGFILSDLKARPGLDIVLAGHSRGGSAVIWIARKLAERDVPVRAMLLFDAVRRALSRPVAAYVQPVAGAPSPALAGLQLGLAVAEAALDFFQRGQQAIDRIPRNVERALHVVRDEAFSNYFLRQPEFLELKKIVQGPALGAAKLEPARRRRFEALLGMHAALRDACRFDCKGSGFSFGNTGLVADPGCRMEPLQAYACTHGAMGGAPLEVRRYITDPRYAADIEAQEVVAMLQVQARVTGFLAEVNAALESGCGVQAPRLGYRPATVGADQSLTRIPPRGR